MFEPGLITQTGKYVLTRNIVGTGGTPAFSVQASGQVEIDLNGFTVSNSNGDDCIEVLSPGVRLTVRNGTLAACQSGIHAPAATQVVVEDVTVYGPSGSAINLSSVGSIAIRRVSVVGAGGDGIVVHDPSVNHNALVEGCTVKDSVGGIAFNGGTVQIRDNRITFSGGGISLLEAHGSEVSGNVVVASGTDGIRLAATHGSMVFNNAVRFAPQHGIHLTADATNNLVRDNVATWSSGHGLFVHGNLNKIEGNTLNFNTGAGLYFSTTGCRNTFGRNMAQGNTGTGVSGCTALFAPDSCSTCNAGPANATFGDNLIPGPPIF